MNYSFLLECFDSIFLMNCNWYFLLRNIGKVNFCSENKLDDNGFSNFFIQVIITFELQYQSRYLKKPKQKKIIISKKWKTLLIRNIIFFSTFTRNRTYFQIRNGAEIRLFKYQWVKQFLSEATSVWSNHFIC